MFLIFSFSFFSCHKKIKKQVTYNAGMKILKIIVSDEISVIQKFNLKGLLFKQDSFQFGYLNGTSLLFNENGYLEKKESNVVTRNWLSQKKINFIVFVRAEGCRFVVE